MLDGNEGGAMGEVDTSFDSEVIESNSGNNDNGNQSASTDTSFDDVATIVAKNLNVSPEDAKNILENDPDYLDNSLRANKLGKYKTSGEVDHNKSSATPENEDGKGGEGNSDEKNSGVNSEAGSQFDFADNVIEGLSGDDFGKLPANVQDSIGNFYQKYSETEAKLTETEARLNKLLEDPIVKARADAKESGSAPEKYEIRNINQAEKNSIAELIKREIGLDDEEATKVVSLLEKSLDVTAKDMAQSILNNMLLEQDAKRKVTEANKKGMSILLQGLGKFNPNLLFQETDIANILEKGDKHPEFKKFKEHLEPIRNLFIEKKMTYKDVVDHVDRFGMESLYAFVAKEMGLPVAINTEKRDIKIAQAAREKAIKPFLKGYSTGTLSTESSSTASRDNAINITQNGGYDPVRLAKDDDYRNRAIESRPGDIAHLNKIIALAEKGRRELQNKK